MYDVTLLLTVMNLGFYFVVLSIAGHADRSVQCFSAVLGADALLTVFYLGVFMTMSLIAGRTTAMSVAWPLLFWSIPVEGHVIARAIGRHWGIGVAIAVVAYVLLFLTYLQFVGRP